MDPTPDSPSTVAAPLSRWAAALQGDAVALGELAASYWYGVYVWWRRSGLEAEAAEAAGAAGAAGAATVASFTRWMTTRPPSAEDSEAGLMREWLPARLAELAAEGLEVGGETAIEIEAEWAEGHYASEPEGEPDAVFHRRWTLTVLEFTMQALRAEYVEKEQETLFAEVAPFIAFADAADAQYAAAAERAGVSVGALRLAVFEFRARHRELLRGFVADTLADPADVGGEITALLCVCDLPADPHAPPAPLPTAIRTFKPDELLARAMNTVQMSNGGAGRWKPPSDEEVARLFPQFEMRGMIGRGGMGAVYRARQVALDREVAVKLLPLEVSVDQAFADRFVREARAMAKLNHPNIIAVYGFGTTGEGHLFFFMEYVEGANVAQIIRGPGLEPAQAVAITAQVCTALAYAHGKGVIHRDIKPANVMVDTEGHAKVADFGLARVEGADPSQYGQTVTGTIMGTAEYMAPEQKRGMGVDHRADIYSVGAMFYEMLCKEPPQGAMEPPSQRVGCDVRFDQIVHQAMQRLPENRYQSAMEMQQDLEAAAAPLPAAPLHQVPAPRGNAGGNPTPYVPPPEKSSSGLLVTLVIGALLVGGALYFLQEHKTSAAKQVALAALAPPPTTPAPPVTPGAEPVEPPPATNSKPPEPTPAAVAANGDATAMPPEKTATEPTSPATPAAAPTPKTDMEKWLDDLDKTQQEAFQAQVMKPFAAGVEELRRLYLAALDAGQARAATTGKLEQAIIWNDERNAFAETGTVELDDDSTPAPLRPLRAEFRQKLAQIESGRVSRAKPLLSSYDAILQKNIALLTQRGRSEDALLLKNKREELAKAWLEKPASKATVKPFATKDRPFVNTLGMKFVPVPIVGGPTGGQRVLFSVWETRQQDYEAFALETGRKWEKTKEALLPVSGISWDNAQAFCAWLTDRERKAGKLAANEIYRLPTDHEWSCAVGIGEQEDATKTPAEKSSKIPDVYPWGSAWPPPAGAENYAGKEIAPALAAGQLSWVKVFISDYQDGFVLTAPVGSFAINRFGLYDLGGNLHEWCEDWSDGTQNERTLRGGCWETNNAALALSSKRRHFAPTVIYGSTGFRVVLSAVPTTIPTPAPVSFPSPAFEPEKLALLKESSAKNPGDDFLALRVAALQLWFGKFADYSATCQRMMEVAQQLAANSYQQERAAKAWCLQASPDTAMQARILAFARKAVVDTKSTQAPWCQQTLGMAEFRAGNDSAAEAAFKRAEEAAESKNWRAEWRPFIHHPVRFFGAMILFRKGQKAEAQKLFNEAEAQLKPLPEGEMWTSDSIQDSLLCWLAYREAKALLYPSSADGWEDLLARLTPAVVEQTGHGWRMKGGELFSPDVKFATLSLPGTLSGTSYQVRVKLRQLAANDVFHVVLPVGDRMTGFELDGFAGTYTGLNNVNGMVGKTLPGVVEGKQVKDSEPHDLELTVRLDGANATITTTLDAKPLYEWTGPTAALSQTKVWATTPPGSLALGAVTANWVVSEIKLKRLGEAAASPGPQAGRPTAPVTPTRPASVASPASEVWYDLLAMLTTAGVKKTGNGWEKRGSALHSPAAREAVLPLPAAFSGTSYQVRLRGRQETVTDATFLVSLPVGDRMVAFALDGWGGETTSLQFVNGKGGLGLPEAVGSKQVKDSRPHDLELTVRLNGANATITTTLDNRPLFEWTGPVSFLGGTGWPTPPDTVAIGTNSDGWTVSDVKVRQLKAR